MKYGRPRVFSFSYKVLLSYEGTHYQGFQWQKDTPRTIQAAIHSALQTFLKSDDFLTRWASRTDTGAHALGQVGQLLLNREYPEEILLKGLNFFLPPDIRFSRVEKCSLDFDPKVQVAFKEYWYVFSNVPQVTTPFGPRLVANFPHPLPYLPEMVKAMPLFVGEHDFRHYYHGTTDIKTTVRTLFECEFHSSAQGNFLCGLWYPYPTMLIRIRGTGFLKKMVRLIVGTLWNLGRGAITFQDVENSLKGLPCPSRHDLGPAAPASGLYLKEICYHSH